MTSDEIIAAARKCLGTPYAHQGRIIGVGLDCIGVIIAVAREFFDVEDVGAYGMVPDGKRLQQGMELHALTERIDAPEPGAILLMRFKREPQHLAICAGDTIIHSYAQIGKVTEHRLDERWKSRIVRVYKLKGMQQ